MSVDTEKLFDGLTTPLIADACMSLGHPLRFAPPGISAVVAGQRVAGRVCLARHYGSVDVFLEALESAQPGDVLVVDNAGRADESCVGDLIVLEAQAAGLAGIVIWGLHRDTSEIEAIGLPLFSYGTNPAGPQRLDARDAEPFDAIRFGDCLLCRGDLVFGDSDGVLFVAGSHRDEVIETARAIASRERAQAALVREGRNLREQLRFSEYLGRRAADPAYSFRAHLRQLGGEIEK